ncbi:glycosyltransferase family 4 protein [Thelephora ganbajun]|uniref:Glycosyltransferase family 4 protein n=1 Tax=Thelephora ganbajun TaxID=370292 RepID=A0ACB6ZWH2_THEGA|nr:glycosyltransferase family 4 protein [Thelephora ganbajun]
MGRPATANGDGQGKRRFSIAMVSDFFHPDVGGVENHIYMLSTTLMRMGHKVIVISHSHPPDRVGIRWLSPGLKVYHIPFPTIASSATLPNFFTFLPYLRTIALRERVDIIHGHASLSSLAHEGIMHAHHMGIRTVFTDHSLFGFDDAASILTNKLLEGMLSHVDAAICVSHTGRENTILRSKLTPRVGGSVGDVGDPSDDEDSDAASSIDHQDHERVINREFGLDPGRVHVIPNAIVTDKFKPYPREQTDKVTIVVLSRLAYRKGIDLLVAAAPRICAKFPHVHFVIGGDGPKLIDLLQMREKYVLQDRIELLGPIHPRDVRSVLARGTIFMNTSLTEAFGIAILEAACAGLYVVSTRVGGIPEILPEDMISFANPDEDDVFRAISDAVRMVCENQHDPTKAHDRISKFYSWEAVAERTEVVYQQVYSSPELHLWDRLQNTLRLGTIAGPIFCIILVVDCLFFLFLECLIPRDQLDFTDDERISDGTVFDRLRNQENFKRPPATISVPHLRTQYEERNES